MNSQVDNRIRIIEKFKKLWFLWDRKWGERDWMMEERDVELRNIEKCEIERDMSNVHR